MIMVRVMLTVPSLVGGVAKAVAKAAEVEEGVKVMVEEKGGGIST